MSERDKIQRLLKKYCHNTTLQIKCKNLKWKVKKIIHAARTDFYNNKFIESNGDTAATWRVIRKLNLNKSKDSICSSMTNKVDDLNDYFVNVGKKAFEKSQQGMTEANDAPQFQTTCHNSELFRPQPVDVNTVILTIKELKNTNPCGSDDIPFIRLRDAVPVITLYLTCIINTSIVTGVFPTASEHSLVIPIYKTGAVDDPGNYRPISLLSIISKILDKIIATP